MIFARVEVFSLIWKTMEMQVIVSIISTCRGISTINRHKALIKKICTMAWSIESEVGVSSSSAGSVRRLLAAAAAAADQKYF